eukprot:3941760-Pleurochrysis_carterae.AAC.1
MTRRGFRSRTIVSITDPILLAEELRLVAMNLSRTQAELAASRTETEHFKKQHRNAAKNYTFWKKKAQGG